MPWLHVKPRPGPPTVEQVTRFGNGGAVRAAFIPPLPARKEGKIEILQTAERAEVVDASERSRVALLPPGPQLLACTTCLPAPGHPQPDRLWGVGHELAAFEEAHQIVTPNGSDVCE